ncbi:MAG: WD40/YVTN/BNR-like repeat-containing protein, partial [Thermoanaerobaculia bacterium]
MRFRLPLRSVALLLLLAFAALGDGRWTIQGPDGGNVKRLLFDPGDPSIVYAAATNGLFRSADGGRHWLGAAELLGTTVLDVAVAKSDPRSVFAASPDGLYKSTDRGLSWSLIQSSGAFALAISAQSPHVIYDVSISGLVQSTDGGVTFGARGSGLPSGNPTALAVDPQNASIVYAAFPFAAGVYKS